MRRLALRMGYGDTSGREGDEVALTLYKDVQRHRSVVAEVNAKLAALRAQGSGEHPRQASPL